MAYNKETGMWEGFIYKIWNDVNDKIYIGQTINTISSRFSEHKSCARNNNYKNHIYNAMRKIGIEYFHISQEEKIICHNKDVLIIKTDKAERDYIRYYKERGVELYNMTNGGDHVDAGYFKKSVIQYDSEGNIVNEFKSIKDASDYIGVGSSTISAACRKKVYYAGGYIWRYKNDTLTQNELTFLKTKNPDKGKSKKVYQFDLSGDYIKEYPSVTKASKETSVSAGDISSCCLMKLKSAGGYIWTYNKESITDYSFYNDLKILNHNLYNGEISMKPVEQRDRYTGDLINTFKSQKQAAISIGVKSPTNISQCCLNHVATAYGYHWCYVGNFNKNNLLKSKHKQIDMYTKNGKFIKTFNSIEACVNYLDAPNSARSNINNVCNGRRKTAYGYIWKYHNKDFYKEVNTQK